LNPPLEGNDHISKSPTDVASESTSNSHINAVASLSISSTVGIACQIIKGKLIAVLLGPTGMGVLSQLKQLSNLLQFFFGLGFYNGLIRHIALANKQGDDQQVKQQISSITLSVSFVTAVMTAACLFLTPSISAFLFGGDKRNAFLVTITLFSVPFAVLARVYKGILSGFKNVSSIVVAQILGDIVGVLVVVCLVIPFGLTGAAIAFAVYQVARFALLFYYSIKENGARVVLPTLQAFRVQAIKENSGYGLVSLIVSPINVLVVILVSGWIIEELGVEKNGIFIAAWTVSSVYLRVIYESAASYYLPVLAASQNNVVLGEHIDSALRLYMIGVSVVVITLGTIGETAITVMFSRDFGSAGELLAWLLPADLLRIVAETVGLGLYARKQLYAYLVIFIARTGLYLALARFLMPEYGLLGICYAYVITHIFYVLVCLASAWKLISYKPSTSTYHVIVKAIAISCVACGAASMLPLQFGRWLVLVVGILAWCVLFWKTEEMRTIWARIPMLGTK